MRIRTRLQPNRQSPKRRLPYRNERIPQYDVLVQNLTAELNLLFPEGPIKGSYEAGELCR